MLIHLEQAYVNRLIQFGLRTPTDEATRLVINCATPAFRVILVRMPMGECAWMARQASGSCHVI